MSELDKIKETKFKKPKVWLQNVHFDFEKSEDSLGPHIHYVTNAASMRDDILLRKSLDELSEDEINILENIKKQKETEMDENVQKELEAKTKENEELQKKLDEIVRAFEAEKIEKATLKVEKSLEDFTFEDEVMKDVAGVLVGLEDAQKETIVKAFTFLKEQIKEDEEDSSIAKQLENEAGVNGEEPEKIEKSINDRVNEYRK